MLKERISQKHCIYFDEKKCGSNQYKNTHRITKIIYKARVSSIISILNI